MLEKQKTDVRKNGWCVNFISNNIKQVAKILKILSSHKDNPSSGYNDVVVNTY